jgi:hypothetical protein
MPRRPQHPASALDALAARIEIPDLIEPAIGWRGWAVDDAGFRSPDRGTFWRADGTLIWDGKCRCALEVARTFIEARAGQRGEHWRASESIEILRTLDEMVLRECQCGINAFDSAERLVTSSYLAERVGAADTWTDEVSAMPDGCKLAISAVGAVQLSGQARAFERGWRAERARIERVWSVGNVEDAKGVRREAARAGVTYMGHLRLDDLLGDTSALAALARRLS